LQAEQKTVATDEYPARSERPRTKEARRLVTAKPFTLLGHFNHALQAVA
jgi:hypothetical protein